MIIKRAKRIFGTSDKIKISFPGQTYQHDHYVELARSFGPFLIQTLNEIGVEATYNADTATGTIAGVPVMILWQLGYVMFWCDGYSSSYDQIQLTYSSTSEGYEQMIGITLKGTAESFSIYFGSGSSVGSESFMCAILSLQRMSDNAILRGYLCKSSNPVIYTIENGAFLEKNAIVKPATDYANTGAGYEGMVLVPAVTCSMAYKILGGYMNAPALLHNNSYYTIAGVNVVVVNGNILLAC